LHQKHVREIRDALARFKQISRGVIVVLRDGTAGVPVQALPQEETPAEAARTRAWREIGLGAQILRDLGVRSIRLLSTGHHTYVGLGGFGIEITQTEGLEG
jgi:3,4-dihydroxy 2-butanone 4-phosphate synthase/GTP cyclohydrolase II